MRIQENKFCKDGQIMKTLQPSIRLFSLSDTKKPTSEFTKDFYFINVNIFQYEYAHSYKENI